MMRWRSRTRRETFENWQQNVRRVTRTSIRVYFPVLRNHTLIYNTVCSVTTFNFANKFHPLQTVRRILSFFIKPLDNKLGFFRVNVLFCRIVLIMVPVNTRFESTLFYFSVWKSSCFLFLYFTTSSFWFNIYFDIHTIWIPVAFILFWIANNIGTVFPFS